MPKLATVHDAIKIMAEANVVKPESEAGQVVPLTSHAAREFLEGDTSSILYVLEAVQKKKSGPLSRPEQMPPNRGCTLAKVPDFLKRNSRISCPSMRSPMLPRPARRSARLCKPARGPTERQGGRESILRVSIHAPPRGGRRASLMRELPGILFQSTPPYPAIETRFQSTPPASVSLEGQSFNPRPPRGGRPNHRPSQRHPQRFQSTPPARGATTRRRVDSLSFQFQSTPPARGATGCRRRSAGAGAVSIHAPRAGGDPLHPFMPSRSDCFNPRPPRGGRRRSRIRPDTLAGFNPRPPRGGRRRSRIRPDTLAGFNPRPPRGGATQRRGQGAQAGHVSIHAPRAGGRPGPWPTPRPISWFQSTPPARGGDVDAGDSNGAGGFQSTPPARGGDPAAPFLPRRMQGFNPRPPRGGATGLHGQGGDAAEGFNPRPPRGGATPRGCAG